MSSGYHFKIFFYLLWLFAVLAAGTSAVSLEQSVESPAAYSEAPDSETPAEQTTDAPSESSCWYNFGTWSYWSPDEPVTVDYHLESIAEDLGREIYWLFEYCWVGRTMQEQLRQLSPIDDEYATLKKYIVEGFQQLKQLSNHHYAQTRINIIEYIDPRHMPKDLAWQFGVLLALYGNFQKETVLCDQEASFGHGSQEIAEIVKLFLKTC